MVLAQLMGTLIFALVLVLLRFLWTDIRTEKRIRLRAQRLRASEMFARLTMLLRTRTSQLEQITVDGSGLYLRYLSSPCQETAFLWREHGYDEMSDESRQAMLYLLEETIDSLTDRKLYKRRAKRRTLLNGREDVYYQYIMQIDYKNLLQNAKYYDGRMREQLR